METKSKFDGLVVKYNNSSLSGLSDCSLCCLNCKSCEGCPLQGNYYFENPSEFSCMSPDDKIKLSSIIHDLQTITSRLEVNLRLGLVFDSTISLAKSYLYCSLSDFDSIKTFDK